MDTRVVSKRETLRKLRAMLEPGAFAAAGSPWGCPAPERPTAREWMRRRGVARRRSGRTLAPRLQLIPVLGLVNAGRGSSADPVNLGEIPVDLAALHIKPNRRTFALKVRGNSMINAQIADGDLVILEVREPKVGDIVAALIDGETTLKRFVAEDGRLFLRAENPEFSDLVPLHDLSIQGVVRAVVRVCEQPRPV